MQAQLSNLWLRSYSREYDLFFSYAADQRASGTLAIPYSREYGACSEQLSRGLKREVGPLRVLSPYDDSWSFFRNRFMNREELLPHVAVADEQPFRVEVRARPEDEDIIFSSSGYKCWLHNDIEPIACLAEEIRQAGALVPWSKGWRTSIATLLYDRDWNVM